ncbi:MAG: hypothetical protein ACI9W4_002216 [Rhodothermales bacterium]
MRLRVSLYGLIILFWAPIAGGQVLVAPVAAQIMSPARECPAVSGFFQPPLELDRGTAPFGRVDSGRIYTRWGTPSAQAPALVYASDPGEGVAIEVQLDRLFGAGDRLEGQYVRVGSDRLDSPGTASPGINGQADFRFEPNDPETEDCLADVNDCSRFDAANVYHHIDRFATDFWRDRMGFDPPFQADVVIHIAGDGAFADADRDLVKLAAGWLFMHNAAKSDDIIYHEYVHLISAALGFVLDTNSGPQAQALSEGYADYFMATFTDDPKVGEWVVTCPDRQLCDGPPDDQDLRTLATDAGEWNWKGGSPETSLKYGVCTRFHSGDLKCKTSWNNFTPRYTWAIIWGSLLWDARTALGAGVVDALVLEAMRNSRGDSETLERAAGRLIEADLLLNGGSNRGTLEAAAANRGIGVVTALEPDQPTLPFEIQVHPAPASNRVTVELSMPEGGFADIRVFDITGRQVDRLDSGPFVPGESRLFWAAGGVAPGLYFVRIETAEGSKAVPVIVAR